MSMPSFPWTEPSQPASASRCNAGGIIAIAMVAPLTGGFFYDLLLSPVRDVATLLIQMSDATRLMDAALAVMLPPALYGISSTQSRAVDFTAIRDAALHAVPWLLERWLPGGRCVAGEYVVRNPNRADNSAGSFKINIQTGRWADFATGDAGGDVISLRAYLTGSNQAEAAIEIARLLGIRGYTHA